MTGSGHSRPGSVPKKGAGIMIRIARILERQKRKKNDNFEALSVIDVKSGNNKEGLETAQINDTFVNYNLRVALRTS